MKREIAEKKIIKMLVKINKIYKRYNPNGGYLGMSIVDNVCNANNEYWRDDKITPINTTAKICVKNKKLCNMCQDK